MRLQRRDNHPCATLGVSSARRCVIRGQRERKRKKEKGKEQKEEEEEEERRQEGEISRCAYAGPFSGVRRTGIWSRDADPAERKSRKTVSEGQRPLKVPGKLPEAASTNLSNGLLRFLLLLRLLLFRQRDSAKYGARKIHRGIGETGLIRESRASLKVSALELSDLWMYLDLDLKRM